MVVFFAASEYLNRPHRGDWPCQFHYDAPLEVLNATGSKYCDLDWRKVDPEFSTRSFPDPSFSKVTIIANDGSELYSVENKVAIEPSDSYCTHEMEARDVYLSVSRLIYCTDPLILFASVGCLSLIAVVGLIIVHHTSW